MDDTVVKPCLKNSSFHSNEPLVSQVVAQEKRKNSNSKSTVKRPMLDSSNASRKIGDRPDEADLSHVVFGKILKSGERVLVPRSRGGFVYGTVKRCTKKEVCYLDPKVSHPYHEFRVEYPNFQGEPMFKELPASSVGKLPSPKKPKSQQFPSTTSRQLGHAATLRDIFNAVMSYKSTFTSGEVVLVSRSSGGFTYGEIVSPIRVSCPNTHGSSTHQVPGWRVIIDENRQMKKDLISGTIGKIPLSGANSEPIIINPIATGEKPHMKRRPKPPSKKKQIDKEFSKRNGQLEKCPPASVTKISPQDPFQFVSTSPEKSEKPPKSSVSNSAVDRLRPIFPEISDSESEDFDDSLDSSFDESSTSPINESSTKASPESFPGGLISLPSNFTTQKELKKKPVIIMDVPNIASKHGQGNFSSKGVKICIDYWQQSGYEVVGFLPEHYVTTKAKGTRTLDNYVPLKCDDLPLMEKLQEQQIIALTPAADYDDSYCIEYAKKNNGIIVTNDRYWDHINKISPEKKRKQVRNWIRDHCISFTFLKDQFIPNPDFRFPNDPS